MPLGNRIYDLRRKQGLSQEELAEIMKVTRQTISNWEKGTTSPNPEQLKLLSSKLNISIDELLDNKIQNTKNQSNSEKLLGIILNVSKIILFIIIIIVAFIIARNLFKKSKSNNNIHIVTESIYCKLYDEEHGYTAKYNEHTGSVIADHSDGYFNNILDLTQYHEIKKQFDIINDYVKKNGGTCNVIKERNLNDIATMYIKEETLTKTSATIVIEEETDYKISYGEAFKLEKYNYETNSFEELMPTCNNCIFNEIAYTATLETPLELYQDWSYMYGPLDNGTYRIIKDAFFDSDIPVTEEDKFYIFTEFVI